MNRLCYRVIFSRVQQRRVVVSELARTGGGSARRGARTGAAACRTARLRPLTLALWLAAGLVSSAAQAGSIVADHGAPGAQRPTVLQTGNGLPQVNIQTPNRQGLSHNTYSRFDVAQRGAVLNNSRHGARSQLAGQVAGNPWLAKGSAKVILNEVNSSSPARLHGFIEVAGRKADVIIASPAGISCSGCGFINAGRSTLAAGRVRLANGQVAGYDTERGRITISGGGMNGSGQDYTRLIARAVTLNARLQAGELTVTTGRNRTDADGAVTAVKTDDPAGRPQFALDTAALGGMYANKITLTGTERGVGVSNAGETGAMQGGFTLSVDGKLTSTGTLYAQQDMTLNTAQLDNRGHLSAGGSVSLRSRGDADNQGQLHAGQQLRLESGGQLRNAPGAAISAGGRLGSAAGDVSVQSGEIQGTAGHIIAQGQLTLSGQQLVLDRAVTQAAQLTLRGGRLSHQQGHLLQTGRGNAQVTLSGGLINAQDGGGDRGIFAGGALGLRGDTLDNRGGSLYAPQLNLTFRDIHNQGGRLTGAQGLTLTGDTLDNQGGVVSADGGRVNRHREPAERRHCPRAGADRALGG